MRNPTIAELRLLTDQDNHSDEVTRAIALTVGTTESSHILSWGQWLCIMVRQYYQASRVDIMLMALAGDAINTHGELLAQLPPLDKMPEITEIPGFDICLVDGCWLTWTDANAFYHAHSGDKISHLGRPPLETHDLNVTVLWYRGISWLEQFRAENEKDFINAENPDPESAVSPTPSS